MRELFIRLMCEEDGTAMLEFAVITGSLSLPIALGLMAFANSLPSLVTNYVTNMNSFEMN